MEPLLIFEKYIFNAHPSKRTLELHSFDFKQLNGIKIPYNHGLPIGIEIPSSLKVKESIGLSQTGNPMLSLNLVDKNY